MKINVDKILSYSIALGIPKLVFFLLKITSDIKTGGVISSRLKDVSFNIGMEEGIGVFVLMGLVLFRLSEYIIEKYFKNKIEFEQLQEKLLTQDIINQIDTYPISKSLSLKLKAMYVLKDY